MLFAGVAGMIVGGLGLETLAACFNHAGALVLAIMQGGIEWALQLPGVSWPASFVWPGLGGWLGGGMLALLAFGYARAWRARSGGYWLPYVVLGLVLVLGVRSVSIAPP